MVTVAFLALGLWGVWFLIGTTEGARRLVPAVLRSLMPAKTLRLGGIDGTLLNGLRLSQVSVADLPGWWGRSRLVMDEVTIAPLPQLLARSAGVRVRAIEWFAAPFAAQATAASLEGVWAGRWTVRDVQIRDVAWWNTTSLLDVQRVEARWPLRLDHLELVENARLRLPFSEPIVLNGAVRDGRFDLTLYANTLDVHEVVAVATKAPAWQAVTGTLSDVRIAIAGPLHELRWGGSFRATTLSRRGLTLTDCPGTWSMAMHGLPRTLIAEGEMACQAGTVNARQTVASLLPSTVRFVTQPPDVSFDVQATSSIGGTAIRIALRGTADQPDLRLTSTPPLPQGVLLAMLVTGKPWRGTTDALTQGVLSSDLALDFIDYFMLGGLGSTIANRFGISGLSLRHQPGTNLVGVETTLVEKVSVGVAVDPATLTNVQPPASPDEAPADEHREHRTPIPYQVGAEYKLNETTSLKIEGERTVLDAQASSQTSTTTETSSTPQTDDKVLFKFKKQF